MVRKSLLAMAVFFSSSLYASDVTPGLSLYGGLGSWQAGYSGDLGDSGTDLDEIGLDGSDANFLYFGFEHPVPGVPNVLLAQMDLSTSGSGTLTSDLVIDEDIILNGSDVQTDIDLSFTDITLYYEITVFDLGLTLRNFDADFNASSTGQSIDENLDEMIPLLYGQFRTSLPFSNVYLTGNAHWLSVDDNTILDYKVSVGYEFEVAVTDIRLEVGFREFSLELSEEEDIPTDIEIDGAFFEASIKF